MMTILLAAMALQHDMPVVRGAERRVPSPWRQSVTARCGSHELSLENFGAVYPSELKPSVKVNGREVEGAQIERLRDDLNHREAAYRIEALCSGTNGFAIRVNVGEHQPGGDSVTYLVGAATIENGTLTRYAGLESSNAETFWYR